jgi:hypothetical protein
MHHFLTSNQSDLLYEEKTITGRDRSASYPVMVHIIRFDSNGVLSRGAIALC